MTTLPSFFNYPNITSRPAGDTDIERLVPIINEAYSYQDAIKGGPRTNPEHLKNRMNEVQFFIYKSDDDIIGCVYLEPRGNSLHFGLLTLTPEWRGTGLGEAIMTAIEHYARATGSTALELDYMSLAPWLKTYYEKYGFHETGKIEPWGSINLVRMSKSF